MPPKSNKNKYQLAWARKNRDHINRWRRGHYQMQDPEKKRESGKRWYAEQKESGKALEYRLKRFGLSVPDYEALLEIQEGKCAICGSLDPKTRWNSGVFVVDHCHGTGVVRGLLCAPCNLGIGQLGDNPDLLRSALVYLERSPS